MDFVNAVDKHKEEKARSEKMSVARVSQLQDALDEQYSIMNSLKTKYGGGEPLPSHCLCCISSAEQSF